MLLDKNLKEKLIERIKRTSDTFKDYLLDDEDDLALAKLTLNVFILYEVCEKVVDYRIKRLTEGEKNE